MCSQISGRFELDEKEQEKLGLTPWKEEWQKLLTHFFNECPSYLIDIVNYFQKNFWCYCKLKNAIKHVLFLQTN